MCACSCSGLACRLLAAHQLADHQAEAARASRPAAGTSRPGSARLGVLHAALLQVGAHRLDHPLGLAGDAAPSAPRARHASTSASITLALLRAWIAELDLALEVLADVGRAAPRPCRRRCPSDLANASFDLGQVLGLDLLQRSPVKSASLPADVLALVVGRELQRKGLRVARLHAAHRGVELLEHLAFADRRTGSPRPCRPRTARRRPCRRNRSSRGRRRRPPRPRAAAAKVRRCLRRMSMRLVDRCVGRPRSTTRSTSAATGRRA